MPTLAHLTTRYALRQTGLPQALDQIIVVRRVSKTRTENLRIEDGQPAPHQVGDATSVAGASKLSVGGRQHHRNEDNIRIAKCFALENRTASS
jgi:hypothetical protein